MKIDKLKYATFNSINRAKVLAPAATVDPSYEMIRTPRALLEKNYADLVQYTEMPQTGHFTAFEAPQLVCSDIRQFVHKVLQRQQEEVNINQSQKRQM
jgi:hypothetical protein